ncbi:hypothetical protein BGZ99_003156 [Dissophora globulifera]|uniref:Uncharacterized protein n=1 Tax=Dissophora globulifera TaxID=979702 RepID=A0A9P6RNU0_9FUNG|nr:hypothetical protein BGZ99_003156 [Dissophora globulifera]
MLFNKSILVSSLILALASAATTSAAATPKPAAVTGQTGTIIDDKNFCIFLPPKAGGGIAENEDKAVAFCTVPLSGAPKAGILPTGFIQSAHLVKTSNYIQVTGRIDRSKYSLSKNDGGGQYDMKAPVGAKCAGYNYFVELVEPDIQVYCIRCCKNKADCPVNKSTYGCQKVLGGSYA